MGPIFAARSGGMFNLCSPSLAGIKCMRYFRADSKGTSVDGYLQVLKLIDRDRSSDRLNLQVKEETFGAEESFEQLELILQRLITEATRSVLIFNSFALIDITIIRLFLRWQHTYEQRTDEWIGTLNLFDALESMGNYRLNEDRGGAG